jgi:DNA-binding MarR family transcriptional regulator
MLDSPDVGGAFPKNDAPLWFRRDTIIRPHARLVNQVSWRYHLDMDETARTLLELVGCLARLIHGEARGRALAAGLQPVHLTALAYLRDANRYSNTPQALAEFLGSTKGTVSQSLLLLYRRGLVEREADTRDGRVVRLRLSAAGERLLSEAGFEAQWTAAAESLPPKDAEIASRSLSSMLRSLQRSQGGRTFGVCATCAHFTRQGPRSFRCGLTGEPLTKTDSTKICREHTPAAERLEAGAGE